MKTRYQVDGGRMMGSTVASEVMVPSKASLAWALHTTLGTRGNTTVWTRPRILAVSSLRSSATFSAAVNGLVATVRERQLKAANSPTNRSENAGLAQRRAPC
jgi:hypothetical protein